MRGTVVLAGMLWAAVGGATLAVAEEGSNKENGFRDSYASLKRTLWTTSRVKGSPDPPNPFRTEVAFPHLRFEQPLELTIAPGSDRLFVAERFGKIFSFEVNRETTKAELLIDLEKTTYGLAFHPRFQDNGYFYVTYVLDPLKTLPKGTRISRFQVRPDNRYQADPASETIIFEWPSGGHNGGCLRFGPDGYLYIATGDGSGIADELDTGQDVSDLLASILRIDVDRPDPGRKYGIPKDNPFVGRQGARPEIWAYGLRQIWKMNFDRQTGNLWAGEVGQDLWEMIYLIQRGGNYGWSVQEGSHPFRPERRLGPSPILKPVVEHGHSDFRSITGGFVYRGKRLPEIAGTYVYGDYDTGRIWGFRHDGDQVSEHRELVDTSFRIIDFGQSHQGEIYVMDFIGGQIHRLVRSPVVHQPHQFPLRLSQTGLFSSVREHKPAPGLIPYSVNSELWSDAAVKERWIAIPGDSQVEFDTVEYPQPAPGAPFGWRFPDGTVIVKTFSLELETGNPDSLHRVETRLLHQEALGGTEEVGDQYWKGYSYVWNEDQTDATLVETRGLNRTYTIADPEAPGGKREQVWRFPSRAECTLCHTVPAKYVLGLNTLQLNKEHDYGWTTANQLEVLHRLGVFTEPLPKSPAELPRIYNHLDPSRSLDERARAYLHSNCAHCHQKWGGGNADFLLHATISLKETKTLGVTPGHGDFGIADGRLLAPGNPERSLILHRMTKLGLGRMPHIASNVVDREAVELIREWISSLPAEAEVASNQP